MFCGLKIRIKAPNYIGYYKVFYRERLPGKHCNDFPKGLKVT